MQVINTDYRQCAISVMDTISDPDIKFDADGISNYYFEYKEAEKKLLTSFSTKEEKYNEIISQIKKDGHGKKYDCILGVSGGVDSTYLALLAKEAGLRVLCVHFDNGWNSELAVKNIENIVNKCGFDLFTYVIDWNEFKDVQLSYFKANVIDIEAVTDIAIFSALDIICKEKKIKHIIDGRNLVTEFTLPKSWICKSHPNLRDIHSKFGTMELKSYPLIGPLRRRLIARSRSFVSWPILNYVDYIKKDAKKRIVDELDWRDYGGKHYESVFTRFYQGYILPQKFNVDKRKAHFSNLIFSGQMTKEEALSELAKPIYPEDVFKTDYDFVLKKLGFTHDEFQEYIKKPQVPHSHFDMSLNLFDEVKWLRFIKNLISK